LYDQELTYTIDNPDGSALFPSRVVTIEEQGRDNQMTTGVIQSTDFRFTLFRLKVNLADGVGRCSRCKWRSWKDTSRTGACLYW